MADRPSDIGAGSDLTPLMREKSRDNLVLRSRAMLLAAADGLTAEQIAVQVGTQTGRVTTLLRSMDDAYIDRWDGSQAEGYQPVWMVVVVPEDAPPPDAGRWRTLRPTPVADALARVLRDSVLYTVTPVLRLRDGAERRHHVAKTMPLTDMLLLLRSLESKSKVFRGWDNDGHVLWRFIEIKTPTGLAETLGMHPEGYRRFTRMLQNWNPKS